MEHEELANAILGLIYLYIAYRVIKFVIRKIIKIFPSKKQKNQNINYDFFKSLNNTVEETFSEYQYRTYRHKNILTNNEHNFYVHLKQFADINNYSIFPKVGLKEIFEVTDKVNFQSRFNMISKKHIDFLIYDDDLNLLFGIELDDSSHKLQSRQKSDKLKNTLFHENNIELIRIPAKMNYSYDYIINFLPQYEFFIS